MSGWPLVRLDQCCQIVSGATPDTSTPEYWGGDIPWATPKDLSELTTAMISDTPRKLTAKGLAASSASLLPPGSVLFSSRAPIGHVAINTVAMATNQGFKSFVPEADRLHAPYLYWWLQTNRTYLQGLGNGATFKEVSKAVVSRIELLLPPLPEQRRIADILDQTDILRAKRRKALPQLSSLAEAIFVDMFGNPADIEDKAVWEPLAPNLLFVTSGSRGWARYYADTGERFLRSLDVRMNRIADGAAVFVNPPESAEARRTRVQANDVLLTITGSRIGRVAPVQSELEGSYVSQHVAILRLNQERLVPEFVSFFLAMTCGGQRQIAKTQYGQTKPGLNLDQIRQLKLPKASLAKQLVFRRRLLAINRVERGQLDSLAKLGVLFNSLQHRAFSGDL